MFYSMIAENGRVQYVLERNENDPPMGEGFLSIATGGTAIGQDYAVGPNGFVRRDYPWQEWDGSAWIDPRTAEDLAADLIAARLAAIAAINAASGPIRRLYVTDIPGQEALYLMKEAEARAWVASANPEPAQFPLIAAEVGITAPTAGEVAQVYLNLAAIYTVAAAQLETVRLGHIAQAETAPTSEAAAAVADAFRALFTT